MQFVMPYACKLSLSMLCHIEQRPPRLDLECYPYLPKAQVKTTSAREYMELLEEGVLL
jgi:hypothetical protein